jgi:putative peptide zinc metalloprotease protein
VVIVGMLVHEVGHLGACRRLGAPHGGIGVGLYWFVPAFYAEVSGAWLLPRLQRAVVDVAGIYLQCVFLLGVTLFALCRGSATALLALWYSHFLVLNTLNPVLKYDGYWLLSDLTGSHNLHRRVRENARLCWRVLNRERDVSLPRPRELWLLVGFAALTALYFSYTLLLIGRHLAHAAHAVIIAWSQYDPGWILVGRAFGLLLLVIMAFGVAMLLARAAREVVGSAKDGKGGPHARALEP